VLAFGPPERVFRDEALLRRTFVKPPPVTALGNRLGLEPRPLTLDDAVGRFTPTPTLPLRGGGREEG